MYMLCIFVTVTEGSTSAVSSVPKDHFQRKVATTLRFKNFTKHIFFNETATGRSKIYFKMHCPNFVELKKKVFNAARQLYNYAGPDLRNLGLRSGSDKEKS